MKYTKGTKVKLIRNSEYTCNISQVKHGNTPMSGDIGEIIGEENNYFVIEYYNPTTPERTMVMGFKENTFEVTEELKEVIYEIY